MSDLTIIILNYNTPDWVEKALTSIQKFGPKNQYTVIVVDNGSEQSDLPKIVHEFSFASLLILPKNVGFAAGNNIALKHVTSKYVMLLNSDAEFVADTHVEAALEYL